MATSLLAFVCILGTALVGLRLGVLLPKHHLSTETKDVVRLSMGLVATMTALVLGLLIASAKDSYDTQKNGLTGMAAKVVMVDRLLAIYGPESAEARAMVKDAVVASLARMWPEKNSAPPKLGPDTVRGSAIYDAIQKLSPQSDAQRALKSQVMQTAIETGDLQWLMFERAGTSISTTFLCIMISWLAMLFLAFSLFAPANPTAVTALVLSAASVSTALFLVLELDRPFDGLIEVSNEPLLKALTYLGQ